MATMWGSQKDPYQRPKLVNETDFYGKKPEVRPPYQSLRDPYPFPKLQNDENFYGSFPEEKQPYMIPTHLAQTQDPWNRLNARPTLSSSRREVYHFDPQAPNDSLDFIIKSKYNQHEELFRNRNQTLFQRETFDANQAGRKLKNRKVVQPKVAPSMGHPIIISVQPEMRDKNSVKNAIEGHHTQTTYKGYSRKPDGGFFTS
ncbi:hypothetical protein BaRGS_00021996 [Batillaria attramentaria]|uniref:Uncharacterized protein n=1 Tax=Batillaria attramentaria TaxID=370345 RepID=A0ABD0KIE9_9CAEN